jgi:hypothetical protein
MVKEVSGKRAVFDTESDGFCWGGTTLHCISICDYDSGSCYHYDPSQLSVGLEHLDSFKFIIGHNISGHDKPFIELKHGHTLKAKMRDTLCMSKMFFPERKGGHSLDYWGTYFGREKPPHSDWTVYSEAMKFRCDEDVQINKMLYEYFINRELSKWKWTDALELEQEFNYWQTIQEISGVDIDAELGERLLVQIDKEVAVIDPQLEAVLPKRVVNKKDVNKPFKMDGTYSKMLEDWYDREDIGFED